MISIVLSAGVFGQDEIWIRPNAGQWHQNIDYKIGIPGGEMYLESQGFTYHFHNGSEILHHHQEDEEHGHHHDQTVDHFIGHVVRTHFLGSNPNHKYETLIPSPHVENYFLGNDSTKWVSNLKLYNQVNYIDLYDGIDLNLYEHDQTLKYDIEIQPDVNPDVFKVLYEGQDSVSIVDGKLFVYTSRGHFYESQPFAFQEIDGVKHEVTCQYHLSGDTLSFRFPEGYQTGETLIIDPILAFSTFTGSSADNWGMTACPDINDKLIAGGIVFGPGYPVTSGAFSTSYNGGNVDLGITKYNANGSALEFSTYIGGTGTETPHSIIVNTFNDLYIMGATSSANFPVSVNGHQNVHAGGTSTTVEGITFTGGTDIYVLRMNANGSSIIGGTFLGGSNNDGISDQNASIFGGYDVAYNYGDKLRGEIIIDQNSNVYITSSTRSSNFPILNGFDTNLSGGQDAIIAKFNSNLTSLLYSTYVGGSGVESGNSIKLSSTGDIYAVGGTTSTNFPATSGNYNASYNGGTTDGYVIKLDAPAYNIVNSTYLGTNDYDQAYIVDLDLQDSVYVYGQSDGNYPVTAGKYVNANSGQFIHKLSTDLTTSQWSSVFGAGTGNAEISPTAFLISDCYEIYVAGWGGNTNSNNSNASGSTTTGFPVTFDAHQANTSGSNFWLGVFEPNMANLKYATFMGSLNGANDHVDGGTSRFNKQGKVYHAVCAACTGITNGFPTTPGVYSPTNGSGNCNMASFLFELAQIEATISTAVPVTCLPNSTVFLNTSLNGNTYQWFFGDGDSSSVFSPTHLYPGPGLYTVTLIVSDINGCYTPDTTTLEVEILQPFYDAYPQEDTICPGTSVQVFATGGVSYSWSPPALFNNPNIASPLATIDNDTTLTVTIQNDCGSTVLSFDVFVFDTPGGTGPDTALCAGSDTPLSAWGGDFYYWSPGITLNDSTIANPIASPTVSTEYVCRIVTPDGCNVFDTTFVLVDQTIATPNVIDEVTICEGDQVQITANGASTFSWTPSYYISNTTINNPIVFPPQTTTYYIGFINACGTAVDSVVVNVSKLNTGIRPDTMICPGEPVGLWATGGATYDWSPEFLVTDPTSSSSIAHPWQDTEFIVAIANDDGCKDTLSFFVEVFDLPELKVSNDVYAVKGDLIPIWAEGLGTIEWVPPAFMTCSTCPQTEVFPPKNTNYTAVLTDANGCKIQDDVAIYYDPIIYVPNTFTPDNNDYNNVFRAVTQNIIEFEMTIYNRWGEVVFQSFDPDAAWDGYYGGSLSQDGVYVWKIWYSDLNGVRDELVGHVVLLK